MKILKALKILADKDVIVMDKRVDMPLELFKELFDDYDKQVTNSPLFGTRTTYTTEFNGYTICAYRYVQ